MADEYSRVTENVPGILFVDCSCIDCDTCRCISPTNFRRCDAQGYSYVHRQPVTAAEWELVEEAIECCPVGAIGKSSESNGVLDRQGIAALPEAALELATPEASPTGE